MKAITIKKSFSNGSVKESELTRNYHAISPGKKMEMALTWVLTKGLQHQITQH